MSLINKMLRDLDSRHATAAQTAMPNEVRSLPEQITRPRISRGLWGLVALAALAIAAGLQSSTYWLPGVKALLVPAAVPPPAPAQSPSPPPAAVPPLPSLTETLPPALEQAAAPVALPATPEPAPTAAPPAAPAAPATAADGSRSGLKLDSSLPQLAVVPPPTATVAEKPKAAPVPRAAAARVVIDQRPGNAQERAEAEYRKGVADFKQGHATDAMAKFRSALQEDARHIAARQTLLSMLAEQKQWDEALVLLKEGLDLMPTQIAWAMALARIQVERGNPAEAWETLQKYMTHGEKNADYQGFAGVLLQRLQKPREASLRYQAALQLKPNEGRWWLGLGLALEADGRAAEARTAFQRARSADGLTPEMLAAIERRLQ